MLGNQYLVFYDYFGKFQKLQKGLFFQKSSEGTIIRGEIAYDNR